MNEWENSRAIGPQSPHWKGFLRPDGSKGIHNKLLILYTVECAAFVAQRVAAGMEGADVVWRVSMAAVATHTLSG